MWNWFTKLTAGRTSDLPNRSVLVYTRSNCHLCDEACVVLKRHGLFPEMIDIDGDPALVKQYTDCVPVVVIDGHVRFRGKVNELLLRRLLRGSLDFPTCQLGIFAKYWQAGAVKTRLAKDVGVESAAALQRVFLSTLLQRLAATPAARVLSFAPSNRRAEFAQLAGSVWHLEPQPMGDLGQRMAAYFHSAFERGCDRVVLIGSDSPTLPTDFVNQAFERLATHSVVLGPSADGGYYLVGASHAVPPIFEGVNWSTCDVWDQTLRLLDAARVPVAQLPPWYDVDHVEDLCRLAAELKHDAGEDLRELTAAVNAALGSDTDG